jgi:hypothetical protein
VGTGLYNPLIRDRLYTPFQGRTDVSDTIIECTEVAGRTVARLRLAAGESGGQEVHIEFTDGTAFSVIIEPKLTRNARLVTQAESGLDTVQTYA